MTYHFQAKVTATLAQSGHIATMEQYLSAAAVSDILTQVPKFLDLSFGTTPPDSLTIEIFKEYSDGED